MAPALTEPLSPTENISSSPLTVSTTPTKRSSRKLNSPINNKNCTNKVVKNFVVKSSSSVIRGKRNRGGGITNQNPTSSKRTTRFRDSIQRNVLAPPISINVDQKIDLQQIPTTGNNLKAAIISEADSSVSSAINKKSLDKKNEQMGVCTAPLNNKNKIPNNSNNKNTSQNLGTIDDNTKESSTAQLLADLTNEALTAEICLRNQLKDVNLVKTSGDPSSPIIQQDTFIGTDTDILVLKVESPTIATAPKIDKINTAHMEAQFNESKSSNFLGTSTEEVKEPISPSALTENTVIVKEHEEIETVEEVTADECQHGRDELKNENRIDEAVAIENYMEEVGAREASVDSSHPFEDIVQTKKSASKLEILPMQELPPVNTDSTMTASEVEDNLEERLSQLDGTAIDSPPPNNHDIDPNEKSSENVAGDPTHLHTPTSQETISNDLEVLQQLQDTPPTPVAQQVQSNQLQAQQLQQSNCFNSPQSTTSTNLLGNIVSNTPQSFIKESENVGVGSAPELEDQDIEEVFKVLKGFEGGTTSDLNVCDLNVLFNEVYMKINETELSGNTGSGGSIAASNTQSHTIVTNPSIQLVKSTKMEEEQMEIERRQQQMQRKIDFLLRRLRKLQARYMCKHTSEEIAGLFEWSARQASKGITNSTSLHLNESAGDPDPTKCFLKVIAARPPASDWKDVHEALVPANQISTFLRKIESVANAQQLCTTTTSANLFTVTHKKNKKTLIESQVAVTCASNTLMGNTAFNESKAEEVVVATLDENITDELAQISGLLQSEMSEVQKAIDSDATESSSGGESADEMITYNNTQQQTLPITKRAAWRYSRDRAAIASRWSWLLSQISDLEIKIRQHSELHQDIIRTKGPVTCGNSMDMDTKSITEEQYNEEMAGSCRTRGYIPSLFRKRKLIQTTNIHTISKKAARPSTIKCGCQWPLHPCALCTGRLDPTAPRDLPDTMMMSDRIALLDSGYHPVLSFRENVNNALHFEAITKQPEWQQRVMRCQTKSIAKNVWKAEREAAAAAGGHPISSSKKYSEAPLTKRRYVKKKDKHNNDEKPGSKSSSTITGVQQLAVSLISESGFTPTATSLTSTTSFNDVGNGTATLSTTTSTTPLVANKGITKSTKRQHCPVVVEEIAKDSSNSLPAPKCSINTSFPQTTPLAATTTNKKYIHQTSDCLPTNCDQFNPNQTPSSLISNSHNNSSKNNKHRKLSSSTVVNSHHYNHPNASSNNLYNGDSGYEYWGGAGENFNVRSRTSSPTHGSSGSLHHKYERYLDRKNRISYDIDNIVIPYSVAAATRVEVLPYKEIPTPKWRVIDNENEEVDINKLKITKDQELEMESSLDTKPFTNGHACDDKLLLESIESNSIDGVECSKEFAVSLGIGTIKCKSFKESETDHAACINKKKVDETFFSTEGDIKNENVVETSKEPVSKKLKIDSSVINIKNKNLENETGKECSEEQMELQNTSKSSIEEDEDISDEAMFSRHERALTEERRKFQTYLKFPWSTRSRANRRIDSRAESSGANTPDPSSPAPQTPSVGGGDLESIPSPLNPATPSNSLDTNCEAGDFSTSFLGINSLPSLSSKRYERRRTTSTKRDREVERRSSTPDSRELIPPFEPLTFPLTEEQFEELLSAMPSDHCEDSKRFDDCYLPSGSGSIIVFPPNKYPRTVSGPTSKRSSRSSTLCGDAITTSSGGSGAGSRRIKSSNSKNIFPISADDSTVDDMLLYEDDYEDDYPKHHLAPNDDHLTADSVMACNGIYVDDDDDIYGDQYEAYVGRQQRQHRGDSEEDSSEEEPFQDDDPNDPEWRGETEERLRKKV